jgi:hypothetical protein
MCVSSLDNKIPVSLTGESGVSPTLTHQLIKFVLVEGKEKNLIFRNFITEHHSYVKSPYNIGRAINYLIFLDGSLIGVIGLGSAPLLMSKPLLEYFRVYSGKFLKETKKVDITPIFNKVANNWRFCLLSGVPKNTGSRCLALLCKLGAKEWKRKYGDELRWILTFVGDGKEGIIYKAAGWQYLGVTSGIKLIFEGDPKAGITKSKPKKQIEVDIKKIYLRKLF